MPYKMQPQCLVCQKDITFFEDEIIAICALCGAEFEADSTCANQHHVCHTCRQIAARREIIDHCLKSGHKQPHLLLLELMQLPKVAMHGPEHHLLLSAALLTAYCNEKGLHEKLAGYLAEANERSMSVPGGACGMWGICGAAVGSGIYMSIVTAANPLSEEAWKTAGQLTARCAHAVSAQGGPRCCKRDSFLSLIEAAACSNQTLGTHFVIAKDLRCNYFLNNSECKKRLCPFFPQKSNLAATLSL